MKLNLAATKVTRFGSMNVTLTPVARFGPLLITFMLYVRFLGTVEVLTVAGMGVDVLVMERSARSCAALLPASNKTAIRLVAARKHTWMIFMFASPSVPMIRY